MTHKNMIIFSIDNPQDNLMRFGAHCLEAGLIDSMEALVGCYKGQQEPAFIMSRENWDAHVADTHFVTYQESVLSVSGCNKAYAQLEFLADHSVEGLGSMCNVSEEIARTYPAWTFKPSTNAWYICAHINPDHSKELGPYDPETSTDL